MRGAGRWRLSESEVFCGNNSTGSKTKEHGKGETDFNDTCGVHLPGLVIRCAEIRKKKVMNTTTS